MGCSSLVCNHSSVAVPNLSSSATSVSHSSSNLITNFIPTFPKDRAGFSLSPPHISRCQMMNPPASFPPLSLRFSKSGEIEETLEEVVPKPSPVPLSISPEMLENLVYNALVWSSLNGLVVGDRSVKVLRIRANFLGWVSFSCLPLLSFISSSFDVFF